LGKWGENEAEKYLIKNQYQILQKNYQKRAGEIDLVCWDTKMNEIAFVEVKTRRSKAFGEPEEAVTPKKLKKLEKTALHWLSENKKIAQLWRIDIIAIHLGSDHEIIHLKNVTL